MDMNYTETQKKLQHLFVANSNLIKLPDSNMQIIRMQFHSNTTSFQNLMVCGDNTNLSHFCQMPDFLISENQNFSYPVFIPDNNKYNKAIVLLHGLNERSWAKYLSWAYYLAHNMQRPVILFPISFHMNRAPKEWSDARQMTSYVVERKKLGEEATLSSFVNLALSIRLAESPLRFFTSGQQSADDLVLLLKQIKNGDLPFLENDTTVDFFSYSIGAFLSQILFLANPDSLLSNSKLFMFCGGSVFSEMNGISKLIMDEQAFNKLHNFYVYGLENTSGYNDVKGYIHTTPLGRAFRAMLSYDKLKEYRNDLFKKLNKQIQAIGLIKDTVIPVRGILGTLGGGKKCTNAEVMDFPYAYSHEMPFPLFTDPTKAGIVDCHFEQVFSKAVAFLK
jgi:pimeloyl-ACP methyl ester carboxylesterase